MDILREECQADLLTNLGIIRGMYLKFTTGGPEGNLIHTFLYIFRLKVIIYADINALVFIAQLPALRICPGLDIGIQRLGLADFIYRSNYSVINVIKQ